MVVLDMGGTFRDYHSLKVMQKRSATRREGCAFVWCVELGGIMDCDIELYCAFMI